MTTRPSDISELTPFPQTAGLAPTRDRIVILDALRGFLLYFILVANLPGLSGFWFLSGEAREALMTPIESSLLYVIEVLLHGKFYTLFSLLFGIGFALILSRIQARGEGIGIYCRRLAVLAGIGLVHMLIWSGDILLPYAICGFVLLLFRNVTDAVLLKSAVLLIFLPVGYYALAWLTGGVSDPAFHLYGFLEGTVIPAFGTEGGPAVVYQSGSLAEMMRMNLVGFGFRWTGLLFEGRLFKVLGVFLIGLWVGRRILEGGFLECTALLKRILVVGLVIGLPANMGLAYLLQAQVSYPFGLLGLVQYLLYAIGVVPLAFAYAAGFVLLWRSDRIRPILGAFVPLGRMALTNYLTQTLVAVFFFYGIFGQGRMGTYTPSDWLLFAAVVVAIQMAFSALWLRHFRYGPLEWAWRGATYGFGRLGSKANAPMPA